jgi:hypothetical protein
LEVFRLTAKEEIVIRTKVAYEQLAKAHDMLCKTISRDEDNGILDDFLDATHYILEIQVKLGALKREEDL